AFPIAPAASLLDFPRAVIGSDGQLYVTGNLFRLDRQGNATFVSARVYAFRTADLYTGLNTTPQTATVGNDPATSLPGCSLRPAPERSGSPACPLSPRRTRPVRARGRPSPCGSGVIRSGATCSPARASSRLTITHSRRRASSREASPRASRTASRPAPPASRRTIRGT